MPRKRSVEIQLSHQERALLSRWHKGISASEYSLRGSLRADIIMRAAVGQTNYRIAKELGISRTTVKKWRHRFARERTAGLRTRPIPGRPKKSVPSREAALEQRTKIAAHLAKREDRGVAA